jgi:DNA-directed RNA polymerase specialized sigma24 family protein
MNKPVWIVLIGAFVVVLLVLRKRLKIFFLRVSKGGAEGRVTMGEPTSGEGMAERKGPGLGLARKETLQRVIEELSSEDQSILRMRIKMSVPEIARSLQMEQKPLYRRLEKIYRQLRQRLAEEGFGSEDVADLLD